MSLDHIEKIDAVGIEAASDTVVLSLLDHWDWNDTQKHLLSLQAKLNSYFEFIETKQIYEAYPSAVGKRLRIDVVFRFSPPDRAKSLLDAAASAAEQLDTKIICRVH